MGETWEVWPTAFIVLLKNPDKHVMDAYYNPFLPVKIVFQPFVVIKMKLKFYIFLSKCKFSSCYLESLLLAVNKVNEDIFALNFTLIYDLKVKIVNSDLV